PRTTLFPYTTLFRSNASSVKYGNEISGKLDWRGNHWRIRIRPMELLAYWNPKRSHQGRSSREKGTAQYLSLSSKSFPSTLLTSRSEEHTSELQSPYD